MLQQEGQESQDAFTMTDEQLDEALANEQSQLVQQEEQQPEQTDQPLAHEDAADAEPEVETVEKEEDDKALVGMRKEISKQREKRRALEQELNILKGQMMALQKPADEPKKPQFEVQDDELVDGKVVKTLHQEIQAMRQDLEQQRAAFEQRVHRETERRIEKCQVEARKQYSAEKVGAQYEYDRVVAEGFIPLIQNDPALAKRVRESDNPALEAYKYGLNNLFSPLDLIGNRPAPKPAAKPAPKTLGGAPAGGGKTQGLDIPNLSQAQISNLTNEQLEELMRKQK